MASDDLKRGSCIKVYGNFVKSLGKGQSIEFKGIEYELMSNTISFDNDESDDGNANERLFSICNTALKPEVARHELLHLRHRLDYFAALNRIRAGMKEIMRSYMKELNYLEVDPPHLTLVDCEGAGETFSAVNIHKNSKNIIPKLSVSGQLHLEALVLGLSQVYSLGPIFRADKSGSRHHLAEFLMLEAESVLLTDVDRICADIEGFVRYIINGVIEAHAVDMDLVRHSNLVSSSDSRIHFLNEFLQKQFSKITFADGIRLLKQEGVVDEGFEDNLSKLEEQHLIRIMGGGPVFVTDFPVALKPFYCKTHGGRSLSVDLLLPGVGEVAGGSVREDDWTCLRDSMRRVGVSDVGMKWYMDLRRGGGCPHGGYGLGVDRFIQFLTDVHHIQDVVPFPRTYDQCTL